MKLDTFPRFKSYLNRSILAVDYGTVVTGLATFCPGRDPWPLPFGKIIYQSDEQVIKEILTNCQDESIEVVVLGLPFFTDGKESEMTKKVREFGHNLEKLLPADCEFHFQDETLSSFEAEDRMKRDPRYNFKVDPKQIDALAASIILEEFIKSE